MPRYWYARLEVPVATILDIRGTHGSGKSYIMHSLIALGASSIEQQGEHLGHHVRRLRCGILGSYERVCGGCDGIKTADEVVRRVRLFARVYQRVALEGILVAHTFKRYNALAVEMTEAGHRYVFAFLDTPLNECVRRVRHRRAEAGNGKPLDPSNVVRDWHRIWERLRPEAQQAGREVVVLNHRDPLPQVLELLNA